MRLNDEPLAAVAVVGGSGLYELADAIDSIEVDTPWGVPAQPCDQRPPN